MFNIFKGFSQEERQETHAEWNEELKQKNVKNPGSQCNANYDAWATTFV